MHSEFHVDCVKRNTKNASDQMTDTFAGANLRATRIYVWDSCHQVQKREKRSNCGRSIKLNKKSFLRRRFHCFRHAIHENVTVDQFQSIIDPADMTQDATHGNHTRCLQNQFQIRMCFAN